jgi:dihydrofolate synthase/folylpolyglutamate synthase
MKLGLQNITRLCEAFGNPEKTFKSILVAGTNGKGSVSLKIAKSLQLSGFKTGLFSSPHISCFRERIQVDGELISEEDTARWLSKIFEVVEAAAIPATFFEMTTILALCYFAEKKVDFAVLEVGLGGRLDATNVVMPALSVITSIQFDHMAFLGNSLEMIAQEKGGTIRSFVPVILGPSAAAQPVLIEMAHQKEAPCVQVAPSDAVFYDDENSRIARAALESLSKRYPLDFAAIEKGLLYRPPCRFQCVPLKHPPAAVILDVAHNTDGIKRLFEAVAHFYPGRFVRVVVGLSKDKDVEKCLQMIAEKAIYVHLVEAVHPRAAPVSQLKEMLPGGSSVHATIQEGVETALAQAAKHDEVLLVCGSFFIMDEARQALGIIEPRDPLQPNESASSL